MGWYYVITQEIRESFEGKEADVFAVINGFSQEGQGCFYGSLSLLSQFCGIKSKTTTQRILKSLVAKGAIVKTDELHNGVKFCTYKVNKNWYGISKIDMGGVSEIDTNKKEGENINIDSLYKGSIRFQKPSLDDIRQYCISRGNNVDPEQFLNFYESKGWMVGKTPMRDWRAAIRTWEKRENDSPRRRSPMTRSESVFEHNIKVMDKMFGTDLHAQAYGNRGGQADEQ
ncbi:MAG: hypothetical protein IKY16_02810 [Bacteroidales bacterium]|nr:hypothetical protein [Bacteroidales bacterium]